MAFTGRIRVGAKWIRKELWKHPKTGYCGKIPPKVPNDVDLNILPGEILKPITAEEVVRKWVKSLRAEGRSVSVVEDDGYYTVTAP